MTTVRDEAALRRWKARRWIQDQGTTEARRACALLEMLERRPAHPLSLDRRLPAGQVAEARACMVATVRMLVELLPAGMRESLAVAYPVAAPEVFGAGVPS